MKAIISTIDHDAPSLIKKAIASKGIVGRDLVREVTCIAPYVFEEAMGDGRWAIGDNSSSEFSEQRSAKKDLNSELTLHVVVMDYGVKLNILRMLKKVGCHVTVMPASAKAEEVLALKPDGVLLSNGPGDPEAVTYAIEEIKKLFGRLPIFGICLGQQLLGLAYGGRTYKLKFGHRGANQPIKELATGKVYITSENHGFAVDLPSIKDQPVRATHINLNDNTIEGIEHERLPIFSVQYHPEASPGPHDSYGLFAKFRDMMVSYKTTRS
jgi:carbamoyl-phosphate synthase small subunit